MAGQQQIAASSFIPSLRPRVAAFVCPWICAIVIASATLARGQTLTVLHNFTRGGDGAHPVSTLTRDAAGNLYGTTSWSTSGNCSSPWYECATVFKLSRRGSGWLLQSLYTFDPEGRSDGYGPEGQLARDASGVLYGATYSGGVNGFGTVFEVRPSVHPPVTVNMPWTQTRIHDFDGSDGWNPVGDLVLDSQGTIYGTSCYGGSYGGGTVFKLTHTSGGWMYSVVHEFTGGSDGGCPYAGVVLDAAGNIYGTASQGGLYGWGDVYEVTSSGSQTVLYSFSNGEDGRLPYAGVIQDSSGNLFGATSFGGSGGSGVVFELSPGNGGWSYSQVYPLPGGGWGPYERLARDAAGNLFGTMYQGGASQYGVVFKLTPSAGGWAYSPLHVFTGGEDGAYPYAGVVLDSAGNLFGTTLSGGTGVACDGGCGVVWEITP